MKTSPLRRARRKSGSQGRTFFRSATSPQPAFFGPAEALVQKKCESCAHAEKSEAASQKGATAFIQKLPGRGEPLPPVVREFFSSRMAADFSSVRIHRDAEAAQSASALHAQAYTVGNDIVFNRDKYAPGTNEGRSLLSHELVHVLQQRSQSARALQKLPEKGEPGAAEKDEESDAAAEEPVSAGSKEHEEAALTEGEKLAQPMALPDFTTFGKPSVHADFAKSVTFNGKTEATFDGGVGQTKNLKGVPGKDCSGCDAAECVHVTGSLVITYHVSTTVTLPDVPDGLTPCQEKRVRDAINNKIKPHEDQHVSAFGTYNGAVTLPINFNGCKADLAAHVQAMHDAHAVARENAARGKSAALDPFHVSVNLDCEDEPPKK